MTRCESLLLYHSRAALTVVIGGAAQWISSHHWQAHKQPISALAVSEGIILTGSSDATLRSWNHELRDGAGACICSCSGLCLTVTCIDQVTEGQTIDLKRRYALDVAISTLPNSSGMCIVMVHAELLKIY